MKHETHTTDFCVVGGGMAGLCAALAAARHGANVILIQDRPVLGGNASSEIRMHVCGAHGPNNRETGLIEEIELENRYRNANSCYSIWDSVLYGIAQYQENLTLLLNCSCTEAAMDGDRIRSVEGWQLTTETWHTVEATLFADCSGDSILAPLSGAEFRIGREASSEFDEDIAPAEADRKTMGMSCLLQARETGRPQPFIPPPWAHSYPTEEDLRGRGHNIRSTNFWWIEVGGEDDSIHDTETLRDELLRIAFGVWDHIKNHGDHDAENWALDWVGFLPGKRESRRYVGDHILTQNDVRAEGRFDDIIGYGGWTMDDHFPAGFYHPQAGTIFHPAPSPFGIPYRCLYSKNVANLLFAGRNISATHAAMSATRVMATCAVLGQAAGTAAALGIRHGCTPRGVYEKYLTDLQQTLMDDDCYLPWTRRSTPTLCQQATLSASEGDPKVLRNGIDRPVGDEENAWTAAPCAWAAYDFGSPAEITEARLVFDSDLNRGGKNMRCNYPLDADLFQPPQTLVRGFRIETKNEQGEWSTHTRIENNYQRLVRVPINAKAQGVRFVPETTWGAEQVRVFAFEVK